MEPGRSGRSMYSAPTSELVSFVDNTGVSRVRISHESLSILVSICHQSGKAETGGILVGHYVAGEIAVIDEVTSPPSDSKRSRYFFERGTEGLSELLSARWLEGRHYLGEWHYHACGDPTPSRTDTETLQGIAANPVMHCPNPLLLIVDMSGNFRVISWLHNSLRRSEISGEA